MADTDPCVIMLPNEPGRVAHDYLYVDDDYGSLGDGGSYEVYRCRNCGRYYYSPMPD